MIFFCGEWDLIALHSTVIMVSGRVINLSKYAIFYRSLSPCFAVSGVVIAVCGVVNGIYRPAFYGDLRLIIAVFQAG